MSSATGVSAPVTVIPSDQAAGVLNSISNVMQDIAGLSSEVTSLGANIQALIAQIRAIEESRPQPPGAGASDKQVKAYQNALASWNATSGVQIHALQGQISNLNDRINELGKRIASDQDKLNNLKNVQLPSAQENDRQKAEQQLDAAKKQFESLGDQTSKDLDKIDDPSKLIKAFQRKVDSGEGDPSLRTIVRAWIIVAGPIVQPPASAILGNASGGARGLPLAGEPAATPVDSGKVDATTAS